MLMRLHKIRLGSKGFTLVELMVVVGILGVLGAVAFPMITSTLPNYRLRAVARELVIDFKKARLEAVKHNRDVVVEFDFSGPGTTTNIYRVYVNMDQDVPREYNTPPDILLSEKELPGNIVFLSSNFSLIVSGRYQAGYSARGLPLGVANKQIEVGIPAPNSGDPPLRSYTLSVGQAGGLELR